MHGRHDEGIGGSRQYEANNVQHLFVRRKEYDNMVSSMGLQAMPTKTLLPLRVGATLRSQRLARYLGLS